MSNRAMARMYSAGGGGGYGGGGEGDSIMSLLQNLFGDQSVSGGPQFDPVTGKFNYQQFQSKPGFFNKPGQRRASELNQISAIPAFLNQQQGDINEQLQKLIQSGALEQIHAKGGEERLTQKEHDAFTSVLGKEKAEQLIKEIEARGGQERMTQKQKYELDSVLGKERADQLIHSIKVTGEETRSSIGKTGEENRNTISATGIQDRQNDILKQHLAYSSKEGMPYNEQNINVADKVLTDPRIKNSLQATDIQTDQNHMMNRMLNDPATQAAFTQGQQQHYLAPAFQNQRDSVISAQPNSVNLYKDIVGENKLLRGPESFASQYQSGGFPMTDPKTGVTTTIGGQVKTAQGYKPGGVGNIVPDALLNQARQMQFNQTAPSGIQAMPTMQAFDNSQQQMPMDAAGLKQVMQLLLSGQFNQ